MSAAVYDQFKAGKQSRGHRGGFSLRLAMTPLLEGCYVVQGEPSNAAMLDLCIKCEWATLGRGCFRARRLSCAQSRSQQSCLLLFRSSAGRALTVRGARITSSTRIAVSIRMSNVRPHVQGTADFAREIHSQRMALRGNRKGVFGATISNARLSHQQAADRPTDARLSTSLMTIRSICQANYLTF